MLAQRCGPHTALLDQLAPPAAAADWSLVAAIAEGGGDPELAARARRAAATAARH